ncbi:MAG: NAD-binding protein [Betaproteobacteria bacterium]|nr:NAD-binding protein [Betaproteobacteria bacterium]
MSENFFLVLRRLRRPLILAIVSVAISTFGLANIPGTDGHGNQVMMGYFHAFYVSSIMATTLGFSDIPSAFSEMQRIWVIFSVYVSAIIWAYLLTIIFHMTRDSGLRIAFMRNRFALSVRRQTEPFILIVGYGQSGKTLVRMLDRLEHRMVIVEKSEENAGLIETEEYATPPLVLEADGRLPDVLVDAGLTHRQCQAMVVLAGDDDTTQAVAIGAATLNPGLRIIARARTDMAAENLELFSRIETVNPFETFAWNIGQDLGSPEKLRIESWLTGLPGSLRPDILGLPMGHWVICGFGRFGHYVAEALSRAGATWTAIDNNPTLKEEPLLLKRSYSHESLREAGIERAVGFVSCTDRDSVNLAAVMRARAINPKLFVAIRQTHASNASLIEAASANLRFIQSYIISREVRQLITSPLLTRFVQLIRDDESGDLARRTATLLESQVDNFVPFLWAFNCLSAYPGLREAFAFDPQHPLTLGELLVYPHSPSQPLRAVALLLIRKKQEITLPSPDMLLQSGDRILFAGQKGIESIQKRHLFAPTPLAFIRTGIEPPRTWIFRKLEEYRVHKRWRVREHLREQREEARREDPRKQSH